MCNYDMQRDGKIEADVNPVLWMVGWKWTYVLVGVPLLGLFLGGAIGGWFGGLIGLVLFFGGPVAAIAGLFHVRKNVDDALSAGVKILHRESNDITRLDTEKTESFSLIGESGDSRLLLPKPVRNIATLIVDDSLLLVHDSAKIDIESLSWKVGDSTTEFYYDQISGVNYNPHDGREGGEFWVNISDGHGQSWQTTSDANEALRAVQDKVRAYKSKAAAV